MGEKEIRPTAGGHVVAPPPPPPPQTTEKKGTGGPAGPDPNTPMSKADFDAQVAATAAAAKTGPYETLFKDKWSEGRDDKGNRYAIDPNGVRGAWNPTSGQYVDPASGKPFPQGWGSGHRP